MAQHKVTAEDLRGLCRYTFDRCIQKGLKNIDPKAFFIIHEVILEALSDTVPGKAMLIDKVLMLTRESANYMHTYYPEGHYGVERMKLNTEQLQGLSGWLYKGALSGGFDSIEVKESPDAESCEECGGSFPRNYCATTSTTVTGMREITRTLCNHCRAAQEDPRLRDGASTRKCQLCEYKKCANHPERLGIERREGLATPPPAPPHPADLSKQLEYKTPVSPAQRYSAM